MMLPSSTILEVRDLSVAFPGPAGPVRVLDKVALRLEPGEVLGIVGESGSGKSMALKTIMGMLPRSGQVDTGQVLFEGRDLLALTERQMAEIRGSRIGLIPQNAMAALNPVHTVGDHLIEVLRVKCQVPRRNAPGMALELLNEVGISSPRSRLQSYPHHLSGGMRQRIMIALALAAHPVVMLADEPTTALDLTIQDQILSVLVKVQADFKMAMVLVSHDLGVIAQMCDHTAVMYGGYVVEFGRTDDIIEAPRHPYTASLLDLDSGPAARRRPTKHESPVMPVHPEKPTPLSPGCPFAPRCRYQQPGCLEAPMTLDQPYPLHASACVVSWRGHAARRSTT